MPGTDGHHLADETLTGLLSALDIVAFERRPDGAFAPVGPLPDWLRHLCRDMTFPFLGAFLDEAGGFWNGAEAGRLKSGRCAEVDETGREFHFEVSAITVEGRQFLLFERASEAEEVRDVLQKARELALERESLGRALDELRAAVTVLGPAGREVQSSTRAILDVVDRLADTEPSPVQQSLLQELRGASAYLQASVDAMVRTSRVFAQRSTPDDHQP